MDFNYSQIIGVILVWILIILYTNKIEKKFKVKTNKNRKIKTYSQAEIEAWKKFLEG
jgi:hypothetical protein